MNELYLLMIVLPCLIVANILLGAAIAEIEHHFDKDIFVKGLKKGGLIYVSIGILVGVSYYMPELSVDIAGETFTLYQAVIVALSIVVAKYAVEAVLKLRKALGIKVTDTQGIEVDGGYKDEEGVG